MLGNLESAKELLNSIERQKSQVTLNLLALKSSLGSFISFLEKKKDLSLKECIESFGYLKKLGTPSSYYIYGREIIFSNFVLIIFTKIH